MATLASVFKLKSTSASWTKLEGEHEFSQFYSKYWGEKIEEEAKAWRELQPTMETDQANDIGPECFALDAGIDFRGSKLWVRQDYIRIYNFCTQRYEKSPSAAKVARSVVITGQPGVGKTFWVTYAMRRRLGERKPFLFYQGGFCFLFVEDGVFQQDVKRIRGGDFAPYLWAFIDADGRPNGIPENLVDGTKLFIMFTTSMKQGRWKTLTKCTKCAVIVMNTWTLAEIRQAAIICDLTNEQQNLAVDAFEIAGPIPRLCIDFVEDTVLLSDYEKKCQNAIKRLTYDSLRRSVLDATFDLDAESHTIFLVRRYEVDDLRRAYIEPRSVAVKIQLMMTISRLQRLQQIDLYHTFISDNSSKAVAGIVFETLGQARLQEGITLSLKPAIKRREPVYFHWKSQREVSMDVDGPEPVFIPPNTEIVYEELGSIERNRLHIPRARNQVAFDSLFILGQFLYIFQFTVADHHDIKIRIEESLSGLALPPKPNWRFVFISPPGCEVDIKATP